MLRFPRFGLLLIIPLLVLTAIQLQPYIHRVTYEWQMTYENTIAKLAMSVDTDAGHHAPLRAEIHPYYLALKYTNWKRRRLGNQLYSYASLRGIADKNDMRPVLPPLYQDLKHIFPHMSIPIDNNTTALERDRTYVVVRPSSLNRQELNNLTKSNMTLDGFFHSVIYFAHMEAQIRKELQFSDDIRKVASDFLLKSRPSDVDSRSVTWIGIHIRRTDFLKKSKRKNYNLGTEKYFQLAMDYFREKFSNVLFVVCSDDIGWCKENIRGEDVVYSEGHSSVEDLAILGSCNHTIVSCVHSTYARWAAWFANGITLLPGKPETSYMPKSWIYIPTD